MNGMRLDERLALAVVGPPMEHDDARIRKAVDGKVVVVTGASFGQGEATARLLAANGAIVVMAARTRPRLAEVAAEIRAAGGRAHAYPLDLVNPDAVDRFAARVLDDHGRVDVLIHNAGKSLRRSVFRSALRPQDMESMVGVNFLGPMRLTLALLPAMRDGGGAHIVNIASAGVQMPTAPRWGFYIACKDGFDRWLRSVAMESKRYGITVTSLYAGHIKSRMVATGWVAMSPGHTPEQAARTVAYAITRRPRTMQPRGFTALNVARTALAAPLEVVLSIFDGRAGETAASEAAFAAAMAGRGADPASGGTATGDRADS
ncbi:MAG: SDR family NAD(P)-dependent oxidoreductase [Gordonia sp. (in: high G+C Gram-positive bacteria)]|uniref:SDR family NAD(P)-dependent oxidoreductase n=1 Tax=Gordonia sp. (in: high G+C Gram-positive bacteria) TaxID=84139 RepID=UPI0039E63107